jgi:hypothetical protein
MRPGRAVGVGGVLTRVLRIPLALKLLGANLLIAAAAFAARRRPPVRPA